MMNQFVLRPLRRYEDRLTYMGLLQGSEGWLMSNAMTKKRDLTKLVLAELKFVYYNSSNFIAFVQGTPGSGKSTITKSLAIQLKCDAKKILGLDSKIHISFSNDESLRLVQKMVMDIIISWVFSQTLAISYQEHLFFVEF